MPILYYGEHQIPYTLKPSRRRRTLALQVSGAEEVAVLAPRRLSMPMIERFIQARAPWVLEKIRYFTELNRKHPPKVYGSGESFLVRGQPHGLQVLVDPAHRHPKVELGEGQLMVRVKDAEKVRDVLRRWYKAQALAIVQEATARLSPSLGVVPKRIRIANQKRRWGSCSTGGDLRFNWRLAMMPPPIADYVVVHELAHMRAANHSARFWAAVGSVLPDYKERRKWLRTNAPQFSGA